MVTIPPRFDVTAAQIDHVVSAFYDQVRRDPTLAPIFAAHVNDWSHHEAKIAGFWRNAILHERSYNGNPMQKHMAAGNIAPAHFALWLKIFDTVLNDELSELQAKSWSSLAHRIGQGLRYGVEHYQNAEGTIPNLSN